MAAHDLLDLLRLLVDQRVGQVAHVPLGGLGPRVEDLVIPTDDVQDAGPGGPRVSFAAYATHQLVRPNRLALPDWLKVHRAGDITIVAVLVGCDFTVPASWVLPGGTAADDQAPIAHRIVLAALNDGVGIVRIETAGGIDYVRLPDPASGMWPRALHDAAVTYLSHEPSTSILGDSSRLGPKR